MILSAIIGGVIATLRQSRIAQGERVKAEAERARAENRFNDVRIPANSFLFEFSSLIENPRSSVNIRDFIFV
ncbi:MAG TPA: hypothetical protein VNI84_21795 [Pyrinomonadaceae bacterium]|nr:hypothetical protein [Pyrinomonadaceae bacterium]